MTSLGRLVRQILAAVALAVINVIAHMLRTTATPPRS